MIVAASGMLAGCVADLGTDAADSSPTRGDEVRVVDNDFEPAHLEVAAGETVTWLWQGRASHDVVGDAFESGVQREGTFAHTFEEPGSYDYECTLHPGMTGTVTVSDA